MDRVNISAVLTDYSHSVTKDGAGTKVFYQSSDEFNLNLVDSVIKNLISNPQEYILQEYLSTFLVENLDTGSKEYKVEEVHSNDAEVSTITVKDPWRNASSMCRYHPGGSGLASTGVRCRSSLSLPQDCFCWDGVCSHPFLPFHSLVNKLWKLGEDLVESQHGFLLWRLDTEEIKINATFSLMDGRYLFPVVIFIEGEGYSLGSRLGTARLKYSIIQFQPSEDLDENTGPRRQYLAPLSPGIFCPQTAASLSRSFPTLPSQFSVQIERVEDGGRRVTYSQHHYDLLHKLVSMSFSPQPDSYTSLFFSSLSLGPSMLQQTSSIIHDFTTGLQYMLNEQTWNCSLQQITGDYGDAVSVDGSLRIKVAKELLNVSPEKFIYAGKRYIRGILADVWVAEKSGENPDDHYSTMEIYFADSDYIFKMEDTYELKSIPIGMSTYHAESRTSSYFQNQSTSHYFKFSPRTPSIGVFDISPCISSQERLFLKVTFQVSYGKLVQFGLPAVQDAIRGALAKLAGVSPLRVADIFLSRSSQSAGVDAWFVLLQRPPVLRGARQDIITELEPDLPTAFQNLVGSFDTHRPQIRLELGMQHSMLVSGLGGSLDIVGEAIHPASRSGTYLSLRSSYSTASMVGLGFAMAIMGLSLGILVGFLLWKQQVGLPSYKAWSQAPILRSNSSGSNPAFGQQELTPSFFGPHQSYQNQALRY